MKRTLLTAGISLLILLGSAYADRVHVVRQGETLAAIAREELGNGARWQEIFDANRNILSSPDRLAVGMRLRIPSGGSTRSTTVSVIPASREDYDPAAVPQPSGMHIVQQGETLMSIARSRLGAAERWKEILDANSDRITHADQIKAGMTLRLPATRSAASTTPPPSVVSSAPATSEEPQIRVIVPPSSLPPVSSDPAAIVEPEPFHEPEPVPSPPPAEPIAPAEQSTTVEAAPTPEASIAPDPAPTMSEPAAPSTLPRASAPSTPGRTLNDQEADRARQEAERLLAHARAELYSARADAGYPRPEPPASPPAPAAPSPEPTQPVPSSPTTPTPPVNERVRPSAPATPATAPAVARGPRLLPQEFEMRSGSGRDREIGTAIARNLSDAWRANGRLAPSISAAHYYILGEYWVSGRNVTIRAAVHRGLAITREFQWRVSKDELAVGSPFFAQMQGEIEDAVK